MLHRRKQSSNFFWRSIQMHVFKVGQSAKHQAHGVAAENGNDFPSHSWYGEMASAFTSPPCYYPVWLGTTNDRICKQEQDPCQAADNSRNIWFSSHGSGPPYTPTTCGRSFRRWWWRDPLAGVYCSYSTRQVKWKFLLQLSHSCWTITKTTAKGVLEMASTRLHSNRENNKDLVRQRAQLVLYFLRGRK